MSWDTCRETVNDSVWRGLSEDGEAFTGILVDEPQVHSPGGKWRDSKRYLFPCFDGIDITILSVSSRGFKALLAYQADLTRSWATITRVGQSGSLNTTYKVEIKPADDGDIDAASDAYEAFKGFQAKKKLKTLGSVIEATKSD